MLLQSTVQESTRQDKARTDMVLIPAGAFLMGSDERADEQPAGEVWVDAFWIDRTPVTNAQFRAFWESGMYEDASAACWEGLQEGFRWIRKEEMRRVPRYWYDPQWNGAHQPIVGVTWFEAQAYACWAGKRLPTEAEWEKAARSDDGRRYPWGNTFDQKYCNIAKGGIKGTALVNSFSPAGDSPYGVTDMAGNIWEWTSTLYQPYPYRADDGREDLREDAGKRVLRGGSWQSRFTEHTRCANRYSANPNFGFVTTGFRCARSGN